MYGAKMNVFLDVALIYDSMGLSQFFEVKVRPLPNRILWCLWGKWTILRLLYWGVYCAKNVYFQRYCSNFCLYRTLAFFRYEIQTSLKHIFYVFHAVNSIICDYFVNAYSVQKCLFFDILHLAKMCLSPTNFKCSLKLLTY